ncbi:hypothetical protein ACUXCC_002929 [Cytobacillus horneckiae]
MDDPRITRMERTGCPSYEHELYELEQEES